MKRVTYLGGSTIVGFGAPRATGFEAGDARPLRRKRKPKVKGLVPVSTVSSSPLCIPTTTVRLITTVMRDLGQPLPNRIKPLNRALRKLIADGVISDAGVINKAHPLLRSWLELVDRNG